MPSRRDALPLLELGLLLGAALLALAFQLTLPSRLPSEADHRAAAAALAREARAGDVVLLFPWWTERARRFLPGRTPLAAERRFGALTLTPYTNGRYRPRSFDAVQAVARARVYLESVDGSRQPCPFDGSAHRCPGPPHLRVAAEWHEVAFQPLHCLWMHPPGGSQRLVAEFEDALPAAGGALRLAAGLIWEHARSVDPRRISTTQVTAEVPGLPALRLELPPGHEGLRTQEQPLPAGAPRGVRVAVQAERAQARWVCVQLQALQERAP